MPAHRLRHALFLAGFEGGPWHGSRDLLPGGRGGPPDAVSVPTDAAGLYMLAGQAEGETLPYRWITWTRAERLASSGPDLTPQAEASP